MGKVNLKKTLFNFTFKDISVVPIPIFIYSLLTECVCVLQVRGVRRLGDQVQHCPGQVVQLEGGQRGQEERRRQQPMGTRLQEQEGLPRHALLLRTPFLYIEQSFSNCSGTYLH